MATDGVVRNRSGRPGMFGEADDLMVSTIVIVVRLLEAFVLGRSQTSDGLSTQWMEDRSAG